VGEAIKKAAEKTGMPEGVFSILYDDGYAVGETLVKHPKTKNSYLYRFVKRWDGPG